MLVKVTCDRCKKEINSYENVFCSKCSKDKEQDTKSQCGARSVGIWFDNCNRVISIVYNDCLMRPNLDPEIPSDAVKFAWIHLHDSESTVECVSYDVIDCKNDISSKEIVNMHKHLVCING